MAHITVKGSRPESIQWMKEHYDEANRKFSQFHPVFWQEDRFYRHGMLEHGSSYFWEIEKHPDSDIHTDRTRKDIAYVLRFLNSPQGIEVYIQKN